MNNSKFMELSNDEIMEVEGGIVITTGAAIALGLFGAGVGAGIAWAMWG